METVKATFTTTMQKNWFFDMLCMLAQQNQPRMIEVTNTGLKMAYEPVCESFGYFFTGTFGTVKEVTFNEWLSELESHILDVYAKANVTLARGIDGEGPLKDHRFSDDKRQGICDDCGWAKHHPQATHEI